MGVYLLVNTMSEPSKKLDTEVQKALFNRLEKVSSDLHFNAVMAQHGLMSEQDLEDTWVNLTVLVNIIKGELQSLYVSKDE